MRRPTELAIPPVTMFSEDRLSVDGRGQPVSYDCALAAGGWARGLQETPGLRFAARCDPAPTCNGFAVEGDVVPLPYYRGGRAFLTSIWRLVPAIDRAVAQSRLIVARLPGQIGWLAVLSAWLRRRRIVIEMVGDPEEVVRAGAVGPRWRWVGLAMRVLTQWAVRRADAVRYMTQSTLQDKYPAHYHASVFAVSSVVLHGSDPIWNVRDSVSELRLITVGSHEQMYKGHDTLIDATALLVKKYANLKVSILGDGWYQEILKSQAVCLGLDEVVAFHGHLERDALVNRLLGASVFVMPSRTEGLPRALVEAMAIGLPCVGTNVGGIPELLPTDFLVPPNDPKLLAQTIDRLLQDEALRSVVGARNRREAQRLFGTGAADELAAWQAQVIDLAS